MRNKIYFSLVLWLLMFFGGIEAKAESKTTELTMDILSENGVELNYLHLESEFKLSFKFELLDSNYSAGDRLSLELPDEFVVSNEQLFYPILDENTQSHIADLSYDKESHRLVITFSKYVENHNLVRLNFFVSSKMNQKIEIKESYLELSTVLRDNSQINIGEYKKIIKFIQVLLKQSQ